MIDPKLLSALWPISPEAFDTPPPPPDKDREVPNVKPPRKPKNTKPKTEPSRPFASFSIGIVSALVSIFSMNAILQESPDNIETENRADVLEAFEERTDSILQQVHKPTAPTTDNILGMLDGETYQAPEVSTNSRGMDIYNLFNALAHASDITEQDAENIIDQLANAGINGGSYINSNSRPININPAYLNECRVANSDDSSEIYACTADKTAEMALVSVLSAFPLGLALMLGSFKGIEYIKERKTKPYNKW